MTGIRGHAGAILCELEAGLRRRGVVGLYGAASAPYGVLSVAPGLTVWCDGTRLSWATGGRWAFWPASDPEGAAEELAKLTTTTR
jgi:hypothetical protein